MCGVTWPGTLSCLAVDSRGGRGMFKFNLFAVMLCLLTLSLMAQTVPRPAGPYFEPLLDWQYRLDMT